MKTSDMAVRAQMPARRSDRLDLRAGILPDEDVSSGDAMLDLSESDLPALKERLREDRMQMAI